MYAKIWLKLTHSLADNFQSIFARSALAVTHGEKSSINTNRKSIRGFPMSLRYEQCTLPLSPKGWLKNAVFKI